MVWFDGKRPAALREFVKRGDVPEELFYLQMYRIENSKVIERIKPVVVDTFDKRDEFKDPKTVLQEIKKRIKD